MKVLVSTIGFDEKFVIRFLMRHAGTFSRLYIITAEPMDERAGKALSLVKDFINRYLDNVTYYVISADPLNYLDSIAKVKDVFRREVGEEFIINISGGMRALIIEVVIAAVLSRVNGYLEIELENFRGVVKVPLKVFVLQPLSSEEYIVLSKIVERGRVSAKDLLKELGIPRSTLYKYLKELVRRGVIEVEREDKTSIYSAAPIAKILL